MATTNVDVLVVGAGISGVCAGYHLQTDCPDKSYLILEGRADMGGTWDLFRYPGIRSDSDMYTLGFPFRPWTDSQAIGAGGDILQYVKDTAAEFGIDKKIRFNHWVEKASWDSTSARWRLTVLRKDTGERIVFSARFVMFCSGYYRYDQGYLPDFPGIENFGGTVIHPQHWPDGFDYSGKQVVVIGSGATAMTLVPAMADRASHVTMLQRSPTYVIALPDRDPWIETLKRVLPEQPVYELVRWRSVLLGMLFYQLSRQQPRLVRRLLRRQAVKHLGEAYVDEHFTPQYNPWDQRLCLIPNADLFKAIRAGTVSVVTDRIKRITSTGITLESGKRLKADVIVTATGLNLVPFGNVQLEVDGSSITPGNLLAYKGVMFADIPNLAVVQGYTNASWTLRADLCCRYLCRVLKQMDRQSAEICVPTNTDPGVQPQRSIDLMSGYILRAIDELPKQGNKLPWRVHQNFVLDLIALRWMPVRDRALTFKRATAARRNVRRPSLRASG